MGKAPEFMNKVYQTDSLHKCQLSMGRGGVFYQSVILLSTIIFFIDLDTSAYLFIQDVPGIILQQIYMVDLTRRYKMFGGMDHTSF